MKGEPIIVKQLLQKAKDSALLAIEYYNKPAVSFRSEGFIVMICIAWTSFFHAYFLKNKIKPWYRKKNGKKKPRFEIITEKLPNGQEIKDKKWWELEKCLNEFFKGNNNNPVYHNIKFLSCLRNLIVHRNLPELDATIYAECQACVINLNEYLKKYFGYKYYLDQFLSFSLQLFANPKNFLEFSSRELKNKNASEVVNFIKSFRSSLSTEIFESPQYSYKAVLIQVKNHESKDALALRFIHEKDLTEEQKEQLKNLGVVLIKEKTILKDDIPARFSLNYKQLRDNIKKHLPYLSYSKAEKLRKYFKYKFNRKNNPNIINEDELVYERIHNPKSKNKQSTYFYDPKILDKFKQFSPPITASNQSIVLQIEALVDKILSAKKQNPHADTSQWEQEIDRLVYELYGLSEKEVRIIENK